MDGETLQTLFGLRVQSLRRERDLTQEDLAEQTELSVEYVSKIERGRASPSFSVIARLADVLDTSPVDLFEYATSDEQG